MSNHAAPADAHAFVHESFRVMAVAPALEAMEVHQYGRFRIDRFRLRPVPGNDVVVRRSNDFPSIGHLWTSGNTRRDNGLKVASRTPGRSTVIGLGNGHDEKRCKKLERAFRKNFRF